MNSKIMEWCQRFPPRAGCSECGGVGWKRVALSQPLPFAVAGEGEGTQSVTILCACVRTRAEVWEREQQERMLFDSLKSGSGIPTTLAGGARTETFTFDAHPNAAHNKSAVAFLQAFASGETLPRTHNAILFGEGRTGKTSLAVITAWTFLRRLQAVKWVDVALWVNRARADYLDEETQDELRKLCRVKLVVFDDFDKFRSSPHVDTLLYMVVNERHNKGLATLLTTNVGRMADGKYSSGQCLQDLERMLGDSGEHIVNRLRENGKLIQIVGRKLGQR